MLELEKIRNLLKSDIAPQVEEQNTKPAAVMVVIYGREPNIVMIEKPRTMMLHGGEVAFPGGKITDTDEDLLDTALRETLEEISLGLTRRHVIGQLYPVHTRNSGFTIVPFVSVLESIPPLRANEEVEEILHIPLDPFLRTLDLDDNEEHRSLFEAYKLTYRDKMVWGASARILKQMADIFKLNDLL